LRLIAEHHCTTGGCSPTRGNSQASCGRRAAEAHANTPTRTLLDHLGRTFRTVEDNGLDGNQNPLLYETTITFDIEGNALVVTDARGNTAEERKFAPGGLQLETGSVDASDRWALPNAVGNPLRAWDSRDHRWRWTYDALNRPTQAYVKHDVDDELLRERTVYGESLGINASTDNHRGQVYGLYDTAGELLFDAYDFKGNLLQQTRRFASDYKTVVDWIDLAPETVPATIATVADPLLDSETFVSAWTFDGMSRVATMTTPDDSETAQTYSRRGLVEALAVKIRGAVTATDIVTDVAYNARGQRSQVNYGNQVITLFEYDARSFRVQRIHTTRPHNDPNLREVQDLRYHYDPVGNITQLRDKAQQGVFFDNAYVDPEQVFSYDAIYRLIEAEGREHDTLSQPTATGFTPISHPQNTQAQRRYVQSYTYDSVGNILRMKHDSGGVTQWHRGYDYAFAGNRLLKTSLPGDDLNDPQTYSAPYSYDDHGSMLAISSIPGGLTWDPQDRLQQTGHLGGGDVYYVYDSAGMRVRKVHVNQAGTASKERFYLGPWETYRETTDLLGTPTLDLERETLHVQDTVGAACLIETKTVENALVIANPTSHLRYQHSNHLGTATLELTGAAEVISYEEYHPYGTSAYRAANSSVDVSPKRYRYTGKERDEETGLYYHEARYYVCWLGRWSGADPGGLLDGPNRYSYTSNNPSRQTDPRGTEGEVPDPLAGIAIEDRDFGQYIVVDESKLGQFAAPVFSSALPEYEVIEKADFAKVESAWLDITNETGITSEDNDENYGPLKAPVKEAIGLLLSKPEGRRTVITLLELSKNTGTSVNITVAERAKEYHPDPNNIWIGLRPPAQRDDYKSPKNPFFVKVGHEMIHAIREMLDLSNTEVDVMLPTPSSTLPTEAKIREEHNLPPRTTHGFTFPMPPLVRQK